MSACLVAEALDVPGNSYSSKRLPSNGDQFVVRANYRSALGRTQSVDPVKAAFLSLASSWKRETAGMSSLTDMFESAAYRAIIAMGSAAVPHIINSLRADPDFWFFALTQITKHDPVEEDDFGDVDRMCEAWLKWADCNGY